MNPSVDSMEDGNLTTEPQPFGNDFTGNPSCEHGPCILIDRNNKRAYVCTAFRDRKLCPYYVSEADFDRNPQKYLNRKPLPRNPVGVDGNQNKQENKGLAQYFFSDATSDWIANALHEWKVTDLLCIGAPKAHRYFPGNSILMDIDKSLAKEAGNKFVHYNMCNHHFFDTDKVYKAFIKNATEELSIFCDPPFGARLELLINTFNLINRDRKEMDLSPAKVLLINPCFSQGKIQKLDPSLEMSTYHIEYQNHPKFSRETSPIRLFTNHDLSKVVLPEDKYRRCYRCRRTGFVGTKQCLQCDEDCYEPHCPGKFYRYCQSCKDCFTFSFRHCDECDFCHTNVCPRTGKRSAPEN